jgi:hypothetical protein
MHQTSSQCTNNGHFETSSVMSLMHVPSKCGSTCRLIDLRANEPCQCEPAGWRRKGFEPFDHEMKCWEYSDEKRHAPLNGAHTQTVSQEPSNCVQYTQQCRVTCSRLQQKAAQPVQVGAEGHSLPRKCAAPAGEHFSTSCLLHPKTSNMAEGCHYNGGALNIHKTHSRFEGKQAPLASTYELASAGTSAWASATGSAAAAFAASRSACLRLSRA